MSGLNELQTAIRDALVAADVCGGRIYDRRPPKTVTWPYVTLGDHDTVEDDDECVDGLEVTWTLHVWSKYQGGKQEANDALEAIRAALHGLSADLPTHALHSMRVTALRTLGDPDEAAVTHGVATVEARLELF